MTRLRPRIAPDPAEAPRESRKVSAVAAMLDLVPSQVYRLVEDGTLESYTVGKRGIRIYLDSVADYQARRARAPVRGPASPSVKPRPKPRRNPASSAALKSAIAYLEREGSIRPRRPRVDPKSKKP